MNVASNTMTMRERALAVMKGEKPDRLPFITRLETWYKSHTRSDTLPEAFQGLSLAEVHHAVGVGQLKFVVPYALKLRGVEVTASHEGQVFYYENEPLIENFPGMWDIVATDRPGETITELKTSVGKLRLRHLLLEENVFTATEAYLKEHLIKEEADYRTVTHILERVEYVPLYEKVYALQAELGEEGFVVPLLHRIPFQQALLEYLGEAPLFYALYDTPTQLHKLLDQLDEQLTDILGRLVEFHAPYVEFPDNLTSSMTNPRLFREFCLPKYQKYTEILHGQGKKTGSHTDGNLKGLLGLLAESGLDVCESVSPYPLTECPFDEIWSAWRNGPIIWGAIPSPILEERTSEADFRRWAEELLKNIRHSIDGESADCLPWPILGVVDLFMRHNSIERVRYIARLVEQSPL